MNCTRCGLDISPGDRACTSCGKLTAIEEKNAWLVLIAILLGIAVGVAFIFVYVAMILRFMSLPLYGTGAPSPGQHHLGALAISLVTTVLCAACFVFGMRIARERPFLSSFLMALTLVAIFPPAGCTIGLGSEAVGHLFGR